jgi:hypothetical protein
MGLIGRVLGQGILGQGGAAAIGGAAKEVAEVFTPNATRRMELGAEATNAALTQFGAEFAGAGGTWFDRAVNGLNRLPRPLMAFGTMGLFTFAMVDPARFATRMQGLDAVPEPLWWLLAAVVGFYFGAREAHYFRYRAAARPAPQPAPEAPTSDFADNAALSEWAASAR